METNKKGQKNQQNKKQKTKNWQCSWEFKLEKKQLDEWEWASLFLKESKWNKIENI